MNHKSQTVSAVVITHNNAETLENTLSSLHWTDELVVLDCGSTDGTLALARSFTEKVYFHPSAHPVILRHDALSAAQCDWILLIEPDEWVEEMLRHEIDGVLLNTSSDINGYAIGRKLKFQSQWLANAQGQLAPALRLVKKGRWRVGEDWSATLQVEGEVACLDHTLGYAPFPTINAIFERANRESTLAAYQHLEERGVSTWDQTLLTLICQAKWSAIDSYFLKGGLTNGFQGLLMTIAAYQEAFLKFAKIRALTRRA